MATFDFVIRGARVAAPRPPWENAEPIESLPRFDLAVKDGKVAAWLAPGTPVSVRQEVEADGLILLPGAVDVHVHFRDPGLTAKEDFMTGSLAAVHGGVTTVFDMPNTLPPVADATALREKAERISGRSYVDFGLYGVMTTDNVAHLEAMARAGAIAYKLFLGPTTGNIRAPEPGALLEAFATAARLGLPVVVHAEDRAITEAGMQAVQARGMGAFANEYEAFLASRPAVGEVAATALAIWLGEATKAHVHIAHVALAQGVQVIREAKARGARVSAETGPQYLYCTKEDFSRLGYDLKVLPPIRDQADQASLWLGLADGTLDCVASDHAPHLPGDKQKATIWEAAAGAIGVETQLPLLFDSALAGEAGPPRLSLGHVAWLTARWPAQLFGLSAKGHLAPGADADFCLVDPIAMTHLSPEHGHSRSRNTLFRDMQLRGRIEHVFVRGRWVLQAGEVTGEPRGQWIRGRAAG